jgi:hypothetical protein
MARGSMERVNINKRALPMTSQRGGAGLERGAHNISSRPRKCLSDQLNWKGGGGGYLVVCIFGVLGSEINIAVPYWLPAVRHLLKKSTTQEFRCSVSKWQVLNRNATQSFKTLPYGFVITHSSRHWYVHGKPNSVRENNHLNMWYRKK